MGEDTKVVDTGVVDGDNKAADDTPVAAQDQVSQIADMMSVFEPSKEDEGKETPEEEIPEEKEDETPPAENEDEEIPVVDEKEKDERDKEIEALKARIDELAGLITKKPEDEKKTDEGDYFKQQLDALSKDFIPEFINDEEYENVFEKREKLNEVLKRVQADTVQGMLRAIPKIIGSMVPQYVAMHSKTVDFYKANPDLLDHRETVGKLIDETAAKNPGWDLDKILGFVGGDGKEDIGEVRRVKKLTKKAEKAIEKENTAKRGPGFGKVGHVKQPIDNKQLTGVNKEIDDMLKVVET